MDAIVTKVDHVFLPVDQPGPLFDIFATLLQLPVAWPIGDFGMFSSGGISLGNCNLEIVTGDASANPFFEVKLPATIRGIAFQPALDPLHWAGALDDRQLAHSLPFPFEGKDGVMWTTCGLGGLVADEAIVFLCEYHDASLIRPGAAADLAASGGGPIGVTRVEEITIGVQNIKLSLERWQRLMDPLEPSETGLWHAGDGPAIRVIESPIDGVAGLVVNVSSIDAARDALRERKLLGPVRNSGVGMHHPTLHGLDIWLREQ